MPEIDLEPGEYREKQPILKRGSVDRRARLGRDGFVRRVRDAPAVRGLGVCLRPVLQLAFGYSLTTAQKRLFRAGSGCTEQRRQPADRPRCQLVLKVCAPRP